MIRDSYIEGFTHNPINFGALCSAFEMTNTWLGYNAVGVVQEWFNVSGMVKGCTFALNDQINHTPDLEMANNTYIDGADKPFRLSHPPTLTNSTAVVGQVPPGYLKSYATDRVSLIGYLEATTPSGGIVAFILPAGFRPLGDRIFAACDTAGNVGHIIVNAGGAVLVYPPASRQLALDGVCFDAAF